MKEAKPDYSMLAAQLKALTADENDPLANTANFVALLWDALANINWLGIYVRRDVDDVDAFPGHIACDAASRSELVVPLIAGDELLGVLDIDSPDRGRFSAEDQLGIERLCEVFVAQLDYKRFI